MIVLFISIGVGLLAITDGVRGGSHHETSTYVDTLQRVVIPSALQNGSLDPHALPDFEIQSKSDHGITVKGRFKRGRLSGMKSFHRLTTCGVPSTNQGNVTFTCTVGFNTLNATYPTEIKYGVLPHSDSVVTANLTGVFGSIEVTSNKRINSPYLLRFTVSTMGQISSKITGGLLKGEFPHIQNDFVHRVINDVQQVLLGSFTNVLKSSVARSPLPSGLLH